MLIEAVNTPVTCRWADGELTLRHGEPAYLPDDRGQQLLAKAGARVRLVQPVDWTVRWTQLAHTTSGLEQDDPRLTPVLVTLARCQRSHEAGNLDGFMEGAKRVRRLMLFTTDSTIRWHGSHEHRLTVLGPVSVQFVHCSEGQLWVWVEWQGTGRWIAEDIVTTIEGPR